MVDVSQRALNVWEPSSLFAANALAQPTGANQTGFHYQAGTAGQSGTLEPSWPIPAGAVVTDGSLDWTAVIPPADGEDTIQSAAWIQLNPPDDALVINGQANNGLTASAYLGGGTTGKVYTTNARITMTSGAVYIAQIVLTVN